MSRISFYQRLPLTRLFARGCVGGVVALLILVVSSAARASIIQPDAPQFSLDAPVSVAINADAAGATAPPAEAPAKTPAEQQDLDQLFTQLAGGGNTSSSSSSSSSIGGGAGANAALAYLPADILCDPSVAGWVSGEHRLALPMPPGNSLLRPPRS